jgi:dTDP-4-amino-4,6-dideoxygalactose transaminase
MKTLALLDGRTEPSKLKPANSIGVEETSAVQKLMEQVSAGALLSGFIGRAGSGFLGGPLVKELERMFTEQYKIKHAVSFNSATTALQAAVTALGIGPGDEVITSPFTMTATPSAALLNNAIPVFADIHPDSYCIDPESVRKLITPRTKAILTVNIFGGMSDMDALRAIANEHGLKIIEDNAQAPHARYKGAYSGTIGDIGVFSFNVHKAMQCGEGAVLVTNDDRYARRAQLVRNHGEVIIDDLRDQGMTEEEFLVGNNFRLSEIHAAIAIEQFKKMPAINAQRQELAGYLTEKLKQFSWIVPCRVAPETTHAYYLYPFQFLTEKIGISRATFAAAMAAEGFPLGVGYVKPIYLYPLYQQKRMFSRSQFPFVSTEYPSEVSYAKGICPVTERMFEKDLLVTTVYQPQHGRAVIDEFIDAIARVQEQVEQLKAYERRSA